MSEKRKMYTSPPKSLWKRILSVATATLMSADLCLVGGVGEIGSVYAAETAAVPAKFDSVSAVNYATILGRATDFGIVANEFMHLNHMETTIAVKHYINYDGGNVTDVDFVDGTAQFIYASLAEGSLVSLGSAQRANTYNIEVSPEIYSGYAYPIPVSGGTQGTGKYGNFNIDYDFTSHADQDLYVYPNDAAADNVQRIIDNGAEHSAEITARANDSEYAIDASQYMNSNCLNIDKEEFVNKVVYINVDTTLAGYLAENKLYIIKDPSTIICFNYPETDADVTISRIGVSIDGGSTYVSSVTGSSGNTTASRDGFEYSNDEVDAQINQKIIFNVPTSGTLYLDAAGGVFLVPNEGSNTYVSGSSTGWIVTAGSMENHAEWHYVYKGVSQETMTDKEGQIHFAARKTFTDEIPNEPDGSGLFKPVEDTSVYSEAGDFVFNWYETDANYNFDGVEPVAVENKATNTVKFPTLTFEKGNMVPYETDITTTETVKETSGEATTMTYGGTDYKRVTINQWSNVIKALKADPSKVEFKITYNEPNEGYSDIQIKASYYRENTWWPTNISLDTYDTVYGDGNEYIIKGDDLVAAFTAKDPYFNLSGLANIYIDGYNGLTFTHDIQHDGWIEQNANKVEFTYEQDVTRRVTLRRYEEDPARQGNPKYVSDGETKTFYYYIDEVDPGKAKNGILISKGHVKIKLDVKNDNGTLNYYVTSRTYLDDSENYLYKMNDNVKMSGVEFTLGAFFNKVQDTGFIDLTKTVEGEVTPEDLANVTFTVKNGDEVVEAFRLGEDFESVGESENVVYRLKADKLLEVPVGEGYVYTVEESGYNVNGKECAVSYTIGSGEQSGNVTDSLDISKDETLNVSFKNVYTSTVDKGSLRITKTFGTDSVVTAADLNGSEIAFTITNSEGKYLTQTGSLSTNTAEIPFSAFTSGTLTIENVPVGEYTVTETKKALDGTEVVTVVGTSVTDSAAASVVKGETAEVSFENTYTSNPVSVDINATKMLKNIVDNTDIDLVADQFTFQLKEGDTVLQTAKNKADGSISFYPITYDDAGTHTYTVSEVRGDEIGIIYSDALYTVTVDVTRVKGKLTATKTIKLGEAASDLIFENLLIRGKIAIIKTIKGDVTEAEAEGALTFTISNNSGFSKTVGLDEFAHVEGTKVYSYILENLDKGTYTVEETTRDITGKDVTVKYTFNGVSATEGTPFNVSNGKTYNVAFEDDYTNQKGTLVIEKTIKGALTAEEIDGALTFTVNKVGSTTAVVENLTLTGEKDGYKFVKDGDKYTLTLSDLEVGEYTVTENLTTPEGKTVKVEYTVSNPASSDTKENSTGTDSVAAAATVAKDATTTVAYENEYTKVIEKISYTVAKVWNDNNNEAGKRPTSVTVKLMKGTSELNSYVLNDGNGWKVTVPDLEKFDASGSEIDYHWEEISVEDYTTSYDTSIKNDVKITNTYVPETGSLVIKKTIMVDGDKVTDEEKAGGLTFTVTTTVDGAIKYVNAAGELVDDEATLTIGRDFDNNGTANENGEFTKTFTNLPAGEYTVTETNSTLGDAYELTSTVTTASATVSKNGPATAEIKDEYSIKTADLKLIKEIRQPGYNESYTYKVKIELSNSEIPLTAANVQGVPAGTAVDFTDGKAAFEVQLAVGSPVTITVPYGTKYNVTENELWASTIALGYTRDVTSKNGTLFNDTEVTITNTYSAPVTGKGSLEVQKQVVPDVANVNVPDKSFDITVVISADAAVPAGIEGIVPVAPDAVKIGSTEYAFVQNGDKFTATVQFAIKHGEAVLIENIPAGAAYTVTEDRSFEDDCFSFDRIDNAAGTIAEMTTATALVVNKYTTPETEINVTKMFSGAAPITGARLVIYDITDGDITGDEAADAAKAVHTWTSLHNQTETIAVKVGKSYKIVEIEAPEKYKKLINPITFDVIEENDEAKITNFRSGGEAEFDSEEQTIVLTNDPIVFEALFSKSDVSQNYKDIPSAQFKLVNNDNGTVWNWISKATPEGVVITPGSYTLTEEVAPFGYAIRQKVVKFTLSEEGVITITENNGSVKVDGKTIRLENKPIVFEFRRKDTTDDGNTDLFPDGTIAILEVDESSIRHYTDDIAENPVDDDDTSEIGNQVKTVDGDNTDGTTLENVKVIRKTNDDGTYREDQWQIDENGNTTTEDGGTSSKTGGKSGTETWPDEEVTEGVTKTPTSITFNPNTMDIKGIPAGRYTLRVKIPVGGKYIERVITFEIAENGEITGVSEQDTTSKVKTKLDTKDNQITDKANDEVFNRIEITYDENYDTPPEETTPDTPDVPDHPEYPVIPGNGPRIPSGTSSVPFVEPEDVSAAAGLDEREKVVAEEKDNRGIVTIVLAVCAAFAAAAIALRKRAEHKD